MEKEKRCIRVGTRMGSKYYTTILILLRVKAKVGPIKQSCLSFLNWLL